MQANEADKPETHPPEPFRCPMLRVVLFALAIAAFGGGVCAQELDREDPLSPEVDFILRPSQDPESGSDEFWQQQLEPDVPPRIDAPIGPPLAGPTGGEPIGPALAGPVPAPPEEQPPPVRAEEEADPFAPTGLRLGTFVIRPSIEVGVTATDNAGGGPAGEGAVGWVVEPEVIIRSEDERHELEAILRGEAIFYNEEEFNDREAEARLRGRYDLTSRTSLETELAYTSSLESFTDPDTPEAAAKRPGVETFDAALGITQRFGRLSVGARGFVEREVHEDVTLVGGGSAARDELDNTEYGLRLRTAYLISAALTPFADAAIGRRDFDREVDSSGLERSSVWGELRGGLAVDLGSRLRGEVAIGYRREDLEDNALDDIDAFIADAAIVWSPRRLTELRLDLSTETRPTTLPGASAAILYAGTLTLAQRISPRWRAEIGAGIDHERFVGAERQDTIYAAFAGLSYAFNRTVSLKASYSYERTESDDPGGNADANVVGVRVRIQR